MPTTKMEKHDQEDDEPLFGLGFLPCSMSKYNCNLIIIIITLLYIVVTDCAPTWNYYILIELIFC